MLHGNYYIDIQIMAVQEFHTSAHVQNKNRNERVKNQRYRDLCLETLRSLQKKYFYRGQYFQKIKTA